MRNLHALTLGLTTLLLATSFLPAQRRGRREPPKLEKFTTEERTFEAPALGGAKATYRVFLPVGYADEKNAETRYPLVIWLHGLWEDHDRFYTRGGAQVLDDLAKEGEITEFIVVCPNASRDSFYIDAVAPDRNYATLIVDDLLDHCVETLRIKPERSARAIAGVSMGGYGALKIALDHPDKFGAVAAHSAALLPENPDNLEKEFPFLKRWERSKEALEAIFGKDLDKKKWTAVNVREKARTVDPESLDGLQIRFDCGTEDRLGFCAANQELHEILSKREIDHTFEAVEGGGHGWDYNKDVLPDSLRFLSARFTVRSATSGLGGLFGGGAGAEPDKGDSPKRK